MEAIKDPDQLSLEMRKHFQMTEDVLALMLERKKLMEAHAPKSGAPPSASSSSPSQPGMGGRPGSGMPGGMMQKEMGGMGGGTPGGGMEKEKGKMGGGVPGGGMMQKEMGGMHGGGMSGMGGSATPPPEPGAGAARPPAPEMDEMMRRIAEHSAYMETIQDRTMLGQEMLRHQKMLDQMLQLVQ